MCCALMFGQKSQDKFRLTWVCISEYNFKAPGFVITASTTSGVAVAVITEVFATEKKDKNRASS